MRAQGYMTAALQMYARSTRIAIDTLDFATRVLAIAPDDVADKAEVGVYFYGAYLEGCRWDVSTERLLESNAGASRPVFARPLRAALGLSPYASLGSWTHDVCVYAQPHTHARTHARTHACTQTHTHAHTLALARTRTHTHTHTHTRRRDSRVHARHLA